MEYRSCISSNSSPITCYNSLFQFFAWIVRISMSSCTFSAALSWSLFHYICTSFTECFVKLKLYSVYIYKRFEELLYQNWIISYESWDVAIVDCIGFAVRSSHQSKYTQISLAPALSIVSYEENFFLNIFGQIADTSMTFPRINIDIDT